MIGTGLAKQILPSPNFEERRDQRRPDILLLHYTGMTDADAACKRLCTEESKVSCHYLVHEDGRIVQMVSEDKRAWHAGASYWMGETDINSSSIGIEIHNPGHDHGYPDFPKMQIEAVTALSRDIVLRNDIEAQRVLAHSDVAPGRKLDPGEKFPWRELFMNGVGHWVEPAPLSAGEGLCEGTEGDAVTSLQGDLRAYGYNVPLSGMFDRQTRIAVEAFQRHFRQERVDGIADASTLETLKRLLAAST